MSFAGLRVLSLESRRAAELAELIRKQGGEAVVAPAMREVPLADDSELWQFAARLFAGEFDMVVLLTGVGARQLNRALAARFPDSAFADALRRLTVVARGPKPVAALREMAVLPDIVAPPPNTWLEVLSAVSGHPARCIAVQEYGRSNSLLLDGLRATGAEVTPVRVYRYGLPEDCGPLRQAVHRLAAGEVDVALFTTAVQIEHLARVAAEEGVEQAALDGLRRCQVVSIGPSTTEALQEFGLRPAFEPSQPKLGILVREAAAAARAAATGGGPSAG